MGPVFASRPGTPICTAHDRRPRKPARTPQPPVRHELDPLRIGTLRLIAAVHLARGNPEAARPYTQERLALLATRATIDGADPLSLNDYA